MSGLDLSSLMNGHMSAGPQTNSASPMPNSHHHNRYLNEPKQGLALCAALVAKNEHLGESEQQFEAIAQLINHQFLELSESDDNTTGVKTYARLQQWLELLSEAVRFPQLQRSHTVAIGGSFSSGKTRFINTVLGCPSLLPEDTKPTTSIPTYLFKGQQDQIQALNFFGKKTAIDEEGLKAICHEFNTQYQVTFSHILQLIAVERAEFKYENLIFLDTPGYSKSDNIHVDELNTDENIARAHLRSADYLIWLVDHQNGTVPQYDIAFLQSLQLSQPVLVVMSKTDKKPRSEVERIIAQAKQTLDSSEIEYLDVIGFSALENRETSNSGAVLAQFLQRINATSQGSTLQWHLNNIFADYLHHYKSAQQNLKLTYGTINELIFDDQISADKRQHLKDIHQKTKAQIDALTQQEKAAQAIVSDVTKLLGQLCQSLNVPLANRPSVRQLQALRTKATVLPVTQEIEVEAVMQGDLRQLAAHANLKQLAGRISKVSPIGVSIELDQANKIEMIVLKKSLLEQAPCCKMDSSLLHLPVTIHVINERKATVKMHLIEQ